MYAARDSIGDLFFFVGTEPKKFTEHTYYGPPIIHWGVYDNKEDLYDDNIYHGVPLPSDILPEVTFENSPVKVDLVIKKN